MARVRIEIDDQISEKLTRLGKVAPQSLDRCLKHAATKVKGYIITSEVDKFKKELLVHDEATSVKATRFKKTGKARYRIAVHPRYQVFEKGAFIRPVNAQALMFINEEGEQVYTKHVRIPKKPFFKAGLRSAIKADAVNKALEQSMNLEFKRLGLV